MPVDRVGLALDRVGLEQLVDVELDAALEVARGSTLHSPRQSRRDRAPDDDPVGDPLEHEVELDRLVDRGRGAAEPVELGA